MTAPEPTAQDHENARTRRAIADRQAREYAAILRLAVGAFGPGWMPSHRHFLVAKEEEERVRYTGERPRAAATVYTAKNTASDRRHFTAEGGRVVEHPSPEAAFGPMLLEPHPTRRVEHRGKQLAVHRYSLCWSPFELYEPRTAEQLAALRATRERKKAERQEKKWVEENPLLAWAEPAQREDRAAEERGR
jgi:hypothetical protein